jgi:sialate O-acetylesterase
MVLQRETPIPIWGTAKANEKIKIYFNKQISKTKADKSGNWKVFLKPEKAGGPYLLTIVGSDKYKIKNVLVGDVWICSGQSNMEWSVAQSDNFQHEKNTSNIPFIRQIKVDKSTNFEPQKDIFGGVWKVSDSTTVGDFTGVGYFFAKKMFQENGIPIGLINNAWGGTNIETWISKEALNTDAYFRDLMQSIPDLKTEEIIIEKVKDIEKIQKNKLSDFNANHFLSLDFDDTSLPAIYQPKIWEEQIIGNLDGVVWIRKTFELTGEQAQKFNVLELGNIDDEDITFINGVEVGSIKVWNQPRKYTVFKGILKEGKNAIVIKITDNTGGGGLWGKPEDVKLTDGQNSISLAGDWKFFVEKVTISSNVNSFPSLAYNSMLHPFIPYAIKGVLWYQGESNAGRAYQYKTVFTMMIHDWRQKWNQKDLPFYFAQLATYTTSGNSNEGCAWAELREAQTEVLQLPYTGMCVTTDIGIPYDVHPTNKQEVGKRLANLALHNLYGKNIECNSPSFVSMEITENQIILKFKEVGTGLNTKTDSNQVLGFEIAEEDQVFYPALAEIDKNRFFEDTIVIHFDKNKKPVAVRFGWLGDDSACNLFNSAGLPAIPFRTDDWKMLTKEERFKIY